VKKKKLKQTNASAHLIQCRFKIREGSAEEIRMNMEERICERGNPSEFLDKNYPAKTRGMELPYDENCIQLQPFLTDIPV